MPAPLPTDASSLTDRTMYTVAKLALNRAGIDASQIAGIGITNQRETTICFDKETGKPVYNAIVWQCRRTSAYCDELRSRGYEQMIREKTGLIIDPYFSATKVKWILENVKGAAELAKEGRLLFGTVETWLIYKLSGGRLHVTDYSNASRTMMFNIHTLSWDEEILQLMGIPASMLPKVVDSSSVYGMTEPVMSRNNLITTIAWGLDGKVTYAMEGSIFVGGAAIQWLRDELGLIDNAAQSAELAKKVSDTAGCYVVPAFTGLGAPYWDQYAKGGIHGITRGTKAAHIARAALEGIAFQTMDIVHAMEKDAGVPLSELKVDGGASCNNLMMQFQSDILGTMVIRPRVVETTAKGASYLAGLAVGFWSSLDEIKQQWQADRIFKPQASSEVTARLQAGWKDAIKRTINTSTD